MSSPEWGADAPYGGPPQWGPPQPPWQQPAWGQPQPQWAQPQWAQPQWAQPQWAQPQWGQPQWGPPAYQPNAPWPAYRLRPQRPGPVIAAAVVSFVSALLVVFGTIYGLALSALLSLARGPQTGMGAGLAVVQLVLAGLLVLAGVRLLHRDRRWLLGAAAGQLVISLWWLVVLDDVLPATVGNGALVVPLLYGGLAAVAAGLTFVREARAWAVRPGG